MPSAETAVLSQAGMDGGDGGWAVLRGDNPLDPSGGTIDLAIDEDQIGDSERYHTTEQVAYLVIDPPAPESSASNDVVLGTQMVSGKRESTTDPRLRDVMTDSATLLLKDSPKLVAQVVPRSSQPLTKIEAIDAALTDNDDDWSDANSSDSLLGSIALKPLASAG
jgi:hypothetical protein